MKKLLTTIYILTAIIGIVRIPRVLVRFARNQCTGLAKLDSQCIYLAICDKYNRNGTMYVVTDIFATPGNKSLFNHILSSAASSFSIRHSQVSLYLFTPNNMGKLCLFLSKEKIQFVKLKDVPNYLMSYSSREQLVNHIKSYENRLGHALVYPKLPLN